MHGNKKEVAQWALQHGADVNAKCQFGTLMKMTAIHFAVLQGDVEMVRLLLKTKTVDLEAAWFDFAQRNALQIAVGSRTNMGFDIAKLLVAAGANVNVKCPISGASLLFFVEKIPMLDWLLDLGLDVFEVRGDGRTAVAFYLEGGRYNFLYHLAHRGVLNAPNLVIDKYDLMPSAMHLPCAIANQNAPFIFNLIKMAVQTGVIQTPVEPKGESLKESWDVASSIEKNHSETIQFF